MDSQRSLFRAQAPPAPQLTTIPSVELIHTGHFRPVLGPGRVTADHLRSMVRAAQDGRLRDGVLGIGHFDSRFGQAPEPGAPTLPWATQDGDPAFGWVRNLRVQENDDGTAQLYGDYVGVPAALAGLVVPSADAPAPYRSRSVEIEWDVPVPGANGETYPAVLAAVKLLGTTPPAINDLDDVAQLYGTAAAGQPRGSGHSTLLAEVNVDDIRRAHSAGQPDVDSDEDRFWIREVFLDTDADPAGGYIIEESSGDDQLYRATWSVSSSGEISFGSRSAVEVQYVAASSTSTGSSSGSGEPAQTAASGLQGQRVVLLSRHAEPAAGTARGRDRVVNRDQMVAFLRRFGQTVDENATDDQLRAQMEALQPPEPAQGDQTQQGTATPPPATQTGTTTQQTSQAPPEQQQGQAVYDQDQQRQAQGQLPAPQVTTQPGVGVVQISEQAWRETQEEVNRSRDERQNRETREREALVASALSDGRIRPGERQDWINLLSNPNAEQRQSAVTLLSSLTPVVPLTEIGAQTVEGGNADQETQPNANRQLLTTLWPEEYAKQGGDN